GDSITIGHHQLRYVDSQGADPEQEEFEATMVISQTRPDPDKIQAAAEALESAQEADASEDEKATGTSAVSTESAPLPPPVEKPSGLPTAKLQVLSGNFCGQRTRAEQSTHDAWSAGDSGCGDYATRRGFLHRARGKRRRRQDARSERRAVRCAGQKTGRQRRAEACWRENGLLQNLNGNVSVSSSVALWLTRV
ncbi:MAG: hypothetical protein AAF004_15425, partial [Pseudomonadota bacterium]